MTQERNLEVHRHGSRTHLGAPDSGVRVIPVTTSGTGIFPIAVAVGVIAPTFDGNGWPIIPTCRSYLGLVERLLDACQRS
jgi:hypothetical protein